MPKIDVQILPKLVISLLLSCLSVLNYVEAKYRISFVKQTTCIELSTEIKKLKYTRSLNVITTNMLSLFCIEKKKMLLVASTYFKTSSPRLPHIILLNF